MPGPAHTFLAFFFCAIGLGLSGAWFLMQARSSGESWPDIVDSAAGVQRRQRRRALGMALVALLSLATAAGLVVLDPQQAPRTFASYWLVVLLLVAWLCGLAVVDLFHTIRVQRRWARARVESALEDYLQCLQSNDHRPGGDPE